jgi:hypothetical protein
MKRGRAIASDPRVREGDKHGAMVPSRQAMSGKADFDDGSARAAGA